MEYLCDCTDCLKFDFQNCIKTSAPKVAPVPIDHEKECELDTDGEDEYLKMFEFVGLNSFVALVSEDSNEPVYIIKVDGKERAQQEEEDDFGHIVPKGQLYVSGQYLKKNGQGLRDITNSVFYQVEQFALLMKYLILL